MKYYKMILVSNDLETPNIGYYEVDKDKTIKRLMEIFPDSSFSFASEYKAYNTEIIDESYFPDDSECPVPENQHYYLITRQEFENIWKVVKER